MGERLNDHYLRAVGLSGLGNFAADRGDFPEARRLREQGLEIYRLTGDRWVVGYILWGIAKACVADGDPASARRALEEWTAIARKLGNRWVTPYILQAYAEVLLIEGSAAAAARTLAAAEAGREALGITLDSVDREEWKGTAERIENGVDGATRLEEWNAGLHLGVWEGIDFASHARPRTAAAA